MAHGALLPGKILVAHLQHHLLELVAGSLCCGAATGAALGAALAVETIAEIESEN